MYKKPVLDFDKSEFYVGVDLGTANIVLTILDKNGNPVAGATKRSRVVKDGIVVDFMGAISIVKKMKADLEEKLGIEITKGYTAIPPGVETGSVKAIVNVVESAGIDVIEVVDEPTGGTHMTLVIAGSSGIDFEEAEDIKLDPKRESEVFVKVTPVIQKMATISKKYIEKFDVEEAYLVGGAASFKEAEKIFEKELGMKVYKPYMPLYITPIGIALTGLRNKRKV